MRFFELSLASALISVLPTLVSASCYVCDELIEVDSLMADCVVKRYEDIANEIASKPNGRAAVNFDQCSDVSTEGSSKRGAIAEFPSLSDYTDHSLSKRVYLIDAEGLDCLKHLIETHDSPYDPTVTFDLYESC